jgi:predicted flap endonuclease-1-like 5' DNA nuclease
MLFLLAKVLFLLVLAAALGAAIANWRWRSRFMEVTSEYHGLRDGWTAWRKTIEGQLAALSDSRALAEAVAAQIRAQGANEAAAGAPFGAEAAEQLGAQLAPQIASRVVSQVASQVTAQLATPLIGEVSGQLTRQMSPLAERLASLERVLRELEAATLAAPAAADLQPVMQRIEALELQLAAAMPHMGVGMVAPAPAPAPSPALEAVPRPAIGALPLPAPEPAFESAPNAAADMPRAVATRPRNGSRNLLSEATFGQADDLKRIKGVAKALEKKLHALGVYYFWQIAEWTPEDVAHIDSQLPAFKGRIERDGWVAQAQRLLSEPSAASKPQG